MYVYLNVDSLIIISCMRINSLICGAPVKYLLPQVKNKKQQQNTTSADSWEMTRLTKFSDAFWVSYAKYYYCVLVNIKYIPEQ